MGFKFHIEKKILCYPFKLKYLLFKPKSFLSYIEKTLLFSCEYKVYIRKCFESHIEKITFFFGT